jgi:hypothetical protein
VRKREKREKRDKEKKEIKRESDTIHPCSIITNLLQKLQIAFMVFYILNNMKMTNLRSKRRHHFPFTTRKMALSPASIKGNLQI